MPKKKQKNVAASIAAQTRKREAALPISLPGQSLHKRIIHKENKLAVLGSDGRAYDLSNLLCQPKLAVVLATGLVHYSDTISLRSFQLCRSNLNGRLATILGGFTHEIEPTEIEETFWTALIRLFNEPRENGEPWTPTTRSQLFKSMKYCLVALRDDDTYGALASKLLDRSGFPHNCWPGAHVKKTPTESLQTHELNRIIEACLAVIETLRQRLDVNEERLAQARDALAEAEAKASRPDYSDPYICAVVIDQRFPDRLAALKDLEGCDDKLRQSVQFRHGIQSMRKILYNPSASLAPFVLLLAAKTAMNPDALLGLTWSQIKHLPNDLIVIAPRKDRSTTGQGDLLLAETGTQGGAGDILNLLRRLTHRGSKLADQDDRDRVFISVPMLSGSRAKAPGGAHGPAGDGVWVRTLNRFIEEHQLPRFTLKTFRPTAAEIIYEQQGDALDVAEKLKHRRVQTQYAHYTSDRVRKRARDKLAVVQSQQTHWAQTQGKVDPRGRSKWDRHSTTRGFLCMDIRNSPRPGQKPGRPCRSYGECPSCPLAGARPTDDYAVSSYLALRKRIIEAKDGHITGPSWLTKWRPILTDLDLILAQVPELVLQRASSLRVFMPPIG